MKNNLSPGQLEKTGAKIMAITDTTRLDEIARCDHQAKFRRTAVEKLYNMALLLSIAGGDESAGVREAAAQKLDDDTVLA